MPTAKKTAAARSATSAQFVAFGAMFAYFNRELFEGRLPDCMLNFSRKAKTLGFFAPDRWENGAKKRHEISVNPSWLKLRKPIETASTLVHEMAHLWQQEHGEPSRSGYHNKEWAAKMRAVGLIPSSTGEPGGKETGQHMTHYVDAGGAFARAFARMPKGYSLPWMGVAELEDAKSPKPKTDASKSKYTCPGCDANVWGKPDLEIQCIACEETFELAD
jgi:hypothetical protein